MPFGAWSVTHALALRAWTPSLRQERSLATHTLSTVEAVSRPQFYVFPLNKPWG